MKLRLYRTKPPIVRAPAPLIERSLFAIGMNFIGSFAAATHRRSDTQLCRQMLAATPKEDRWWVLKWLACGAQRAREKREEMRRACAVENGRRVA